MQNFGGFKVEEINKALVVEEKLMETLRCPAQHTFEGWWSSVNAIEMLRYEDEHDWDVHAGEFIFEMRRADLLGSWTQFVIYKLELSWIFQYADVQHALMNHLSGVSSDS